ncbi:RimK/LysX family protein [Shewanella mangrovisoli]|uniref:putative ATP-dependent zinc protease n=1 Tax=Shewanella mangrovisoli TaxID=2864211 RepID=UPI0035B6B35F
MLQHHSVGRCTTLLLGAVIASFSLVGCGKVSEEAQMTAKSAVSSDAKTIIGQSEKMRLIAAQLDFQARIDTGAANTSLHAIDLQVEGGASDKMQDNIGKTLHFTTENEAGEQRRLAAKILKTTTVNNAQGSEVRYLVELDIGFEGQHRLVAVNLRDRSHMDYKLLIGRNWLAGRYVVDVAEKRLIGPTAFINVKEAELTFKTRIDTGAVENSLHAVDIKIDDEDPTNMDNNIGKWLNFTTENERGEEKRLRARIVDTSLIRNAQGSEVRYMVELTLGEPGLEYPVKVNLKDRSQMSNKLLIGRNWLQGHYLVDVTLDKSSD